MIKETQNKWIVTEHESSPVDRQAVTGFIRKYSKNLKIDFQKDISVSITSKRNNDGVVIHKIILKEVEVSQDNFDQTHMQLVELKENEGD